MKNLLQHCFKLPNWFVFFRTQISYRSWWKRTHWQRWKKENEGGEKIKKELGWKFIRINPEAENYIFVEIGKIEDYIAQSNKEAKIKEIKEKLEKEKEAEIKEIKEKLEKKREAKIKELKDKNKELKTKIKNFTTNQISSHFKKKKKKHW